MLKRAFRGPLKPPCDRDCPRREAGCGAACPDWAEYVKRRDQEYERRKDICKRSEAIADAVARCGKKLSQY